MRTARYLHQLVVHTLSARAVKGTLQWGAVNIPCAIGRCGRRARKRERDGATPAGVWGITGALYRADRVCRPSTGLPLRRIGRADGWCDAPSDRNYNRAIKHPYGASAERLWRSDGLYDVIVVLGHNQRPRFRGGGSAIFLHCAHDDFQPTEGCIAVRRADLMRMLPRIGRRTKVRIG